mmetsp:Transcript_79642/g.204851  ORF Transcript_79642/g.204851 Transcript_79642/m.204851 type:complete len:209 (+) Transcript_79642:8155-8781(+)
MFASFNVVHLMLEQHLPVRSCYLNLEDGLVKAGQRHLRQGLLPVVLGMMAGRPHDLELHVHGLHELRPDVLPDLQLIRVVHREGHARFEELVDHMGDFLVEEDTFLLDLETQDLHPSLVSLVSIPRLLPLVVGDPLPLVRIAPGRLEEGVALPILLEEGVALPILLEVGFALPIRLAEGVGLPILPALLRLGQPIQLPTLPATWNGPT